MNVQELEIKGKEIREKIINFHKLTKRGHIGPALSCSDILVTLYYHLARETDSIILSKGHASSALYVILNDLGKIPSQKIEMLEEHPEFRKDYGIEATTGSLGHGLSLGLGMAIADRKNLVYVILGDGECDEGQVWEAARLATDLNASNLVTILDCNGLQGYKKNDPKNLPIRFNAFGWQIKECDGHNYSDLVKSVCGIHKSPLAILAKTVKGHGIPDIENKLESHYFHFK